MVDRENSGALACAEAMVMWSLRIDFHGFGCLGDLSSGPGVVLVEVDMTRKDWSRGRLVCGGHRDGKGTFTEHEFLCSLIK